MANNWYVQLEGKLYGPVNDNCLANLAAVGKLRPEMFVRLDKNGEWIQAKRVKGLFAKNGENHADTSNKPSIQEKLESPIIEKKNISNENVNNEIDNHNYSQPDLYEAPFRTGYVSSNLLPDEFVIYYADTHWFIFVFPIILLIFTILCGLILWFKFGYTELTCFAFVSIPVAVVSLCSLVSRIFQFLFNQYAVTNKRVIMKCGFLSVRTLEVLHNKIASLSVIQDLFGLCFNFGAVIVSAMGDKQTFAFISNPSTFRKRVQQFQAVK